MPEIDSLIVAAELAVALAGFSGVVLALRGLPADRASVAFVRLWRLVETSLASAFFSVLPLAIFQWGVNGKSLWAISSGALALYMLAMQFYVLRRFREALRSPATSWWFNAPLVVLQLSLVVILFGNATGLILEPFFGPYFTAVSFMLALAGLMFARLLLLPSEASGGGRAV